MKILYISNSIIPSKFANSINVMKMCQAFANNGHDVTLLAPDKKTQSKNKSVNVYDYYGVKKNFTIKKLWYPNFKGNILIYSLGILFYLIKNSNFKLIYGRFLVGCYLAAILGKDVIFESHDPIYKRKNFTARIFENLIKSQNFKKLVVISKALKNIYLKTGYLNINQIHVAHDSSDQVRDFKSKITLKGKKKTLKVGYLGSLSRGKGIEVVDSIANKVKKDIEFHIVGGIDKDIKYWMEKINNKNVFFYGFRSQKKIKNYLNSFDICLLPNQKKIHVEGVGNISSITSPLKLFDYMSHKKAIIASDLPVIREVLNKKNSILVKSNKSIEWINAIEKLKNTKLRKLLSNQALKDSYFYTWNKRANDIL
jgi:glycosyltransferase involved in cell wall biosynthesis